MPSDTHPGHGSFTIFRSAAEEAAIKVEADKWDDDGGRPSASLAQVTHVPGTALPYRVALTRPRGQPLERAFATMREAETFIRRNSPASPAALSTLYDRPAPKA
jgi:hypothetical protein